MVGVFFICSSFFGGNPYNLSSKNIIPWYSLILHKTLKEMSLTSEELSFVKEIKSYSIDLTILVVLGSFLPINYL